MPISDSLSGGHWGTEQQEEINTILSNYPQAVVFTSHSHYPIADERAIVQDKFTLVNTGSTSYFDFDWIENPPVLGDEGYDAFINDTNTNYKNNDYMINPDILGINDPSDVPFRDSVNNGLILDLYTSGRKKNTFDLKKINFATGSKIGETFNMDFNLFAGVSSFTRTEELMGLGIKPTFKSDAIAYASTLGNGEVQITFDSAEQSVIVNKTRINKVTKYYQYQLTKSGAEIVPIRFFARNWYQGEQTEYQERNVLHGLEVGATYTLQIFAINSYKNVSDAHPVTITFTA